MKSKKSSSIAKSYPSATLYDAGLFGLGPKSFHGHALEVVRVLQQAGFEAFIVGGGVRDQLLNLHPKDFDVATNAHPEQVRPLFKRCLIIGKRFRLAHVYFSRYEIIEVATFRRALQASEEHIDHQVKETGMISRDNLYGSIEEDALRRDFTINAFYYNPTLNLILDFTKGMVDIKQKLLRLIGAPAQRLVEDPVRILRALRISNKLKFKIEPTLKAALPQFVPLLNLIAPGRRYDEYQKLFLLGQAKSNFKSLLQYDILSILFPETCRFLNLCWFKTLINLALDNTDQRLKMGKTVHPAFLIAVMLWMPFLDQCKQLKQPGLSTNEIVELAQEKVLRYQGKHTAAPRVMVETIRTIWRLQPALEQRRRVKIKALLKQPKFRAAFDFLELRSQVEQANKEVVAWWTKIQIVASTEQEAMIKALKKGASKVYYPVFKQDQE